MQRRVVFEISIHAPREGGDLAVCRIPGQHQYISIHAPREGGDADGDRQHHRKFISIHAPREGGDPKGRTVKSAPWAFQSTPPARGATAILA